ncbi:T9SS type A sorting domain-containing protein [Candidatus Latescibacterota bacterium]
MKRSKRLIILICCISAFLPLLVFAFSDYKIESGIIGNGGTSISNAQYQINGTIGEQLVGHTGSSSYNNEAGFWCLCQIYYEPILVEDNTIPKQFRLIGNFPNPFNPVTEIRYEIPEQCNVKLKIYTISGQLVETLIDETVSPGIHSVKWNPTEISSGLYIYEMEAGNKKYVNRMLLLK